MCWGWLQLQSRRVWRSLSVGVRPPERRRQ
nr:MAG TPA: hypothetical protein [Caudoviricetes sp.]